MKHYNERQSDISINENSFPIRLNIESSGTSAVQPPLQRHRETELMLVLCGMVMVHFPSETAELTGGCGLFINSGVPHTIQYTDEKSIVASVVFDSELIAPDGSSMSHKFIKPLTTDAELSHVTFDGMIMWQRKILELLSSTVSLLYHYGDSPIRNVSIDIPAESSACFELDIQCRISMIWSLLYSNLKGNTASSAAGNEHVARKRTRMMTDFIRDNYRSQISLAEIAASANISKSEASRCFQSCLNTSPVSYLLQYRIDTAMYLLQNSSMSIEAISFECGFGSSSYFCKMFQRYTGTTPGKFRREHHDE
ncbi:MAG: helix-turn-helix transcriptional regulator [Oscillospiraceae bacterium]|nr:helix-turn-helix transcriptional regulator [Oscillospiraceae bacterium]